MESTNRVWQKHLRAKGIVPFFLDRLQQHALSSGWQYARGPFHFPIDGREAEDELSRAYFDFVEGFPYEFYLELTNHCNLICAMCARSKMARPLGVMAMSLYRKIIDEIADKQPHAFIHYYGIGESMVDVSLFDKLAYSKEKGLRNSLLFTNGQLLLVKDNYKRIAESGLTNIGVDLDGFSQETYGKVRVGGDFETAKQGIEKLYAHIRERGLSARVEIAYQVVPGVNEQDLEPFVDWCNANDYEYKVGTMHDWAGLRDDVGASDLIADGEIKIKSGAGIAGIGERSVRFDDGTELPADVIVHATGYGSMDEMVARLISPEVADKVGRFWGYGSGTQGDPGPWERMYLAIASPTCTSSHARQHVRNSWRSSTKS